MARQSIYRHYIKNPPERDRGGAATYYWRGRDGLGFAGAPEGSVAHEAWKAGVYHRELSRAA
jgi:hypothetical protein